MTAKTLRSSGLPVLDLLELFAFVRPATFCVPTPKGIAETLNLPIPTSLEAEAETLIQATVLLLESLEEISSKDRQPAAIAFAMGRSGWPWAAYVLAALRQSGTEETPHSQNLRQGLRVWTRLPEWEDAPPPPPPDTRPVDPPEARAELNKLLGRGAEKRAEQVDYAAFASAAFAPRDKPGEPHFALIEAGTGVGKTLGYVAPAAVWARKNKGTVWLSTFTRNLQRQLDSELTRLYPDPAERRQKVVIRKGRENYFCLLNFEEAVNRIGAHGGREVIALGLVARWALASRDGDMVGGDFPAWLADLLGKGLTTDMTDTRGECTYAGCSHYGKCFIEHSQRRAKTAEIVVANHALVMIQAALGGLGGETMALPLRYVFDEGHHLFGAADSAFSAHLSGFEMADLRRWLVGAEEGSRSRSKGLRTRVEELLVGDQAGLEALSDVLQHARSLAGPGWGNRLAGGAPNGPAEQFLALVRQQVYARTGDAESAYSIEAPPQPPIDGLLDAAAKLETALARIGGPVQALMGRLLARLDREADELDTATRNRIEAVCRSLERRALGQIADWRAMLTSLGNETPSGFVDWLAVDRQGGRDADVGLHRHHVDPTKPFVETVAAEAHGLLVTSATLKDRSGEEDHDWQVARDRVGSDHLPGPRHELALKSPFDHIHRTRIFVVQDVDRNEPDRLATAYRELFLASGGGALGLFTAIQRLRHVYERIATPLDQAHVPLFAQHVDPLDVGSLVDIFRADERACLLGTDAVRDGVDIPGRSLRLIVFDRVPWPRPDLLHKARRDAFGGRKYDEMLVHLKLTQAYGRLLRRADDKGVFVMLDRQLPSRLANAFPEGVKVERVGLAEAVAGLRDFLGDD